MNARNKKFISMYLWIIFLSVTAAYLDSIVFVNPLLDIFVTSVSAVIYICIVIFWMMSIKWRCMHRHIRNYMMAIGACIILLLVLDFLQKEFAILPIIKRQLWYSSYMPIVLVPVMELGAASCSAQPDTQPVEKKYLFLWIPTIVFCLFIMTNELHGLFFDTSIYEAHDVITKHSPMCWIMFSWVAALELVAIVTIVRKSRFTGLKWTRIVAPVLFFVLGVIYMVLVLLGVINKELITIPTAISFFHLAICESCLFLRLLPTNFYYKQFFENTDMGIQLLDANDNVSLRSHKARILTEEENKKLKEAGSLYVDGFEIYRTQVQGGYLVYEKDIRDIHEKIVKLQKTTGELKDIDSYITEQQQLTIRKHRLEEKERIYNEISRIIMPSLDKIDQYLMEIKLLNPEEQRRMMWRINLLGTYIKRRANLELRRKESSSVFGSELSQCFSEFTVSLHAVGISSYGYFDTESVIFLDSAILILDIYWGMIECNFSHLKNISVIQSIRENRLSFFIEALGHDEMYIPDDRMLRYRDYADKHNIVLLLNEQNSHSTMCCTIITEDGRR